MGYEHAALIESPLPKSHFELQCKKKSVDVKSITTLEGPSGTGQFHVIEFKEIGGMINTCNAKLLGVDAIPLKGKKPVTPALLHALPKAGTQEASAELTGANDMGPDIKKVREAVNDAVCEGKLLPRDALCVPVTKIYGTNYKELIKAAGKRKTSFSVDPTSSHSTALLAVLGKGKESIARLVSGALKESNELRPVNPTADRGQKSLDKQKPPPTPKDKRKPPPAVPTQDRQKPPPPPPQDKQTPGPPQNQPSPSVAQDKQTAQRPLSASLPAKPPADPDQPPPNADADSLSRCATPTCPTAGEALAASLQRLLPPAAARPPPPGGAHQAFVALPAELAGLVVGRQFSRARPVVEAAGATSVHFVGNANGAPILDHLAVLRIAASTRAAAAAAAAALVQRLADVIAAAAAAAAEIGPPASATAAATAGGRALGQGPAWMPPQIPEAAAADGAAAGRSSALSYNASQQDNERMRQTKAAMAATAPKAAAAGGGRRKSKSKRSGGGRGRARAEVREGRRQERDESRSAGDGAGGDGGDGALWLLYLDAGGAAAGDAAAAAASPAAAGSRGGRGKRGGAAGGRRTVGGGNSFAALPVEPTSELEAQPTATLARRLKQARQWLAETETLAQRAAAGGARLDAGQMGRVARRGEMARAAERMEEALRDRGADGDAAATKALAKLGPAPGCA